MLLDGEAAALSRKAVEMALAGDAAALRLCLDRTVAPRRERSVELPLPAINSAADILGAIKAVAGAVGRGAITPGEGFALSQMIESFLRAIDASDFDNRLRQLEEAQAASRPDPYSDTPLWLTPGSGNDAFERTDEHRNSGVFRRGSRITRYLETRHG
jgi:hypothetical protein